MFPTPLEVYHRPANLFVAGFIGSPRMNTLRGTLSGEGDAILFTESAGDSPGIRLGLRGETARRLAPRIGQEVILGLRPEQLADSRDLAAPDPDATFEVRVDVVEPVGAETWVYLRTNANALIARVPHAEPRTDAGHTLRFTADLARARFFDPPSGMALA